MIDGMKNGNTLTHNEDNDSLVYYGCSGFTDPKVSIIRLPRVTISILGSLDDSSLVLAALIKGVVMEWGPYLLLA